MSILTMLKLGVAAAALVVAFGAGWAGRDAFCDSAKAKADLAIERTRNAALQADLDATKQAAADDKAALESIETNNRSREDMINELQTKLASQPAAGRCKLGADQHQRLLNISPR